VPLSVDEPLATFVINRTSFPLVMVGGLLVLNQTFNGPVPNSNELVAKSAFVGTLT